MAAPSAGSAPIALSDAFDQFKMAENSEIGLEYLREGEWAAKPRVEQAGPDGETGDEMMDGDMEKAEYDSEPLMDDWKVAEEVFYSFFFVGVFGFFAYLEMPLDILALLVHENNHPCRAGYTAGEEGEEPDAIQSAFNWSIEKTAAMIQPQAFLLATIFTAGKARFEDFDLCTMTSEEAAIYFLIYWLVWPMLLTINIPVALFLSPVYLVGLTIKVFELFIEVAEDGDEINEKVDEAEAESDYDRVEVE